MIAGLEEVHSIGTGPVYQPVFLGDAPGPTIREDIPQWFGLSYALERIAQDRIDQIQYSNGDDPVGPDPGSEILQKLGMKDGGPFTFPAHREVPASDRLRFRVWAFPARPGREP
jgi:hypothetical protein